MALNIPARVWSSRFLVPFVIPPRRDDPESPVPPTVLPLLIPAKSESIVFLRGGAFTIIYFRSSSAGVELSATDNPPLEPVRLNLLRLSTGSGTENHDTIQCTASAQQHQCNLGFQGILHDYLCYFCTFFTGPHLRWRLLEITARRYCGFAGYRFLFIHFLYFPHFEIQEPASNERLLIPRQLTNGFRSKYFPKYRCCITRASAQ